MNNDIRINRSLARTITGVISGIALLVLVISLVVTPGFDTVGYVALGVMLAAVAGFIFIDPTSLVETITGRTGQYTLSSIILSIIFVAVVIGLFVVVREANLTPIDATEQSRYRISAESREVLENLEEPVEAIAFYGAADIRGRDEAELWLNAYENASDGNFTWRFVDPEREPGLAQSLGVESNGTIVLQQGDRTADITFPNERNITNALVRVLIGEDRVVYSLTGHSERDLFSFEGRQLSNIRESLERVGFTFNTLNLLEEDGIPEDADLVMILAPQSQFAPQEIEAISAYMQDGGSLILLTEPDVGSGDVFGAGILDLEFAPNGREFATAGSDGTIKIWDANSAAEILTIDAHRNVAYGVSYSPDGDRLASVSRDGSVRVWDADSGDLIAELEGPAGSSTGGIVFSPDGQYLASANDDQLVRVWDAESLEPMPYSPVAVNLQLSDVGFNEDGTILAGAGVRANAAGTGGDGLLYLWDPATGTEIDNQLLHSNTVLDLAFNPNGETIHTVAADGTEGVYNIASSDGSAETRFEGQPIVSIAFDSSGTAYYSLFDGTIRILEDGAEPVTLSGHAEVVWDAEVRGNNLVSVSGDGDIRLWDADSGEQDEIIASAHASTDILDEYLSSEWGIVLREDIVVDPGSANFTGDITAPRITNFGQSPIVQGLERTPPILLTARSIGSENVGSIRKVNILQTSGQNSWGETTDPFLQQANFDPAADTEGPVTVGVSAENTGNNSRLVVIGDADFVSNNLLQDRSLGNAELMINAVNWATESDQLIDLPSPDVGEATIDQPLQPVALSVTGITLVCLLPGAILLTGIVTFVSRRRRR